MMFSVTAILVIATQLAAVTADCPGSSLSSRTLESAAPAPWHAVIYEQKQDSRVALCGGTLVSPSHVVTAANCFWANGNRTSMNLALFEVAVGKHCENYDDLEQDAQLIKVKSVTLHPWYSALSPSLPYDVAVLVLKTAAILSPAVSPALIAREHTAGGEHLPAGSLGTVADWLGSESRSLSSVQLPYMNFSACADLVHARHTIVPSMDKFCAGVKYAMRTMCSQDIGAGFIYRHPTSNDSILRGVLSSELRPAQFTETCHQSDVAGFTNIADPLTLNWLIHVLPAPAVPCPAVVTSVSVIFVFCHKQGVDQDCTQPMATGSTAVSRCNTGYHIDSSRKSKTSTCSSDGTWTDSHLTCVQVITCPAVVKNDHVKSITCVRGDHLVDCTEAMAPGTWVTRTCTNGYPAGSNVQTAAICLSDGRWSHDDVTCLPAAPGYERLSGLTSWYKHHNITLSWQAAKTSCEAERAHLVILNSEAEFTAMQGLMRRNGGGWSWVGLKESDTKQHDFYTVLGQPLSATGFSRWRPGDPSFTSLGDAVYICPGCSGLHDYPAADSFMLYYICELEV